MTVTFLSPWFMHLVNTDRTQCFMSAEESIYPFNVSVADLHYINNKKLESESNLILSYLIHCNQFNLKLSHMSLIQLFRHDNVSDCNVELSYV